MIAMPASKRVLVLGGGAEGGGGGGCFLYLRGVSVIYRISPCRGRVWDRALPMVSCVRSRQSRFSLFILDLGLSLIPRAVLHSSSFAMRCLFFLSFFLAVSALDGEPVRPVSAGLRWQPVVSMRPGHLGLWFSKPARTRADAHPQTKNALHQQARARHGQLLDTACPELQPRGSETWNASVWNHTFLPFLHPSLRRGAR